MIFRCKLSTWICTAMVCALIRIKTNRWISIKPINRIISTRVKPWSHRVDVVLFKKKLSKWIYDKVDLFRDKMSFGNFDGHAHVISMSSVHVQSFHKVRICTYIFLHGKEINSSICKSEWSSCLGITVDTRVIPGQIAWWPSRVGGGTWYEYHFQVNIPPETPNSRRYTSYDQRLGRYVGSNFFKFPLFVIFTLFQMAVSP